MSYRYAWIGLAVAVVGFGGVVAVRMARQDTIVVPGTPVPADAPVVASETSDEPVAPFVRPAAPVIPEHHRLATLANRSLRVSERMAPAIVEELSAGIDASDEQILAFILMSREDDASIRNLAANILRRSNWKPLPSALIGVLDNADEGPRFRSFAAQFLGDMLADSPAGASAITARLKDALQDRHPEVQQEALWALALRRDPLASETAIGLLGANGEHVDGIQSVAVRCIEEFGLKEHIPALRRLAVEGGNATRVQAMVTLSNWGDEQSRAAFEAAAHADAPQVQRAGSSALQRLKR